jgi:hypothetical protein
MGMLVADWGRTRSAIAAGGNPSASGQGILTSDGELRTFSFTAVQHKDGTVTGQAEVNNRALNLRVHIEIVCLNIIGNRAYVGGFVTQSSLPSFTVPGDTAVFAVEDNGEGANAASDRITLTGFAVFDTLDCHDPVVIDVLDNFAGFNPIKAGNIQVKP